MNRVPTTVPIALLATCALFIVLACGGSPDGSPSIDSHAAQRGATGNAAIDETSGATGPSTVDAASQRAASAEPLWRGDFSTGDLSQWNGAQSASPRGEHWDPSRLTVVPAPDQPSGYALRVTLAHGDVAYNVRHDPPVPLGNRAELTRARPLLREGDERWYRFQVHFPEEFAVDDGHGGGAVFLQWHHTSDHGEPGSPPLLFSATTDDLRIVTVPHLGSEEADAFASWPHRKGHWRDLVVHVRFSSSSSDGLIEAWCDGTQVASGPAMTLFPGYDAYMKMGLYRRPSAKETNVVWFTGMVEGRSAAEVGFGG